MFFSSDVEETKWDIKFKLGIVILIAFLVHNYYSFDETILNNVGIEPFSEPMQIQIDDTRTITKETSEGVVNITPIARYKIYGRIYAKHFRPSKMHSAAVTPYDMSIGFGNFKEKEVYDAINVTMVETVSYPRYKYNVNGQNIEDKYFKENSFQHCFTNNHLCPANENVKKGLSKLRKKDIVYLRLSDEMGTY